MNIFIINQFFNILVKVTDKTSGNKFGFSAYHERTSFINPFKILSFILPPFKFLKIWFSYAPIDGYGAYKFWLSYYELVEDGTTQTLYMEWYNQTISSILTNEENDIQIESNGIMLKYLKYYKYAMVIILTHFIASWRNSYRFSNIQSVWCSTRDYFSK
jgi:hypothetical protein